MASAMVVMRGLAITAGSRWTRLAIMGRKQPSSLEMITVTTRVRLTTMATVTSRWLSMVSRTKLTPARVSPHRAPTWISFQARYTPFTNGIFNISSVVFFLSVVAVFNFLTARRLESRRWS